MASEPEAHAEIAVDTGLRLLPKPTAAAELLGMNFCTTSGDTARKPCSASSYAKSTSSMEPIPVPMDTIRRRVSTSGDPACCQARRPTTVAIFCRYDIRRSSTLFNSLVESSRR